MEFSLNAKMNELNLAIRKAIFIPKDSRLGKMLKLGKVRTLEQLRKKYTKKTASIELDVDPRTKRGTPERENAIENLAIAVQNEDENYSNCEVNEQELYGNMILFCRRFGIEWEE